MYTDPFTDFNHPYWSIAPFYIGDVEPDPYRVGDFPISKQERIKRGWTKVSDYMEDKKANLPPDIKNILGKSIFDQQVWFNNTDGGQTFRLEVVGYGREHVSAEIRGSVLYVSCKGKFDEQYQIPSSEKLDLSAISAKVEHGLLEIIFPAKKQEVKTIKVL